MFSGWSTASSGGGSSTGTGTSGGGWSTGSSVGTSSGGWSTGPTSGTSSGWSFGTTAPVSSGGWSFGTPTQQTGGYVSTGYSYSYQSGGVSPYALPGAGLYAGIFGEGGPYTPLDFPLMHELAPGQRLEDLNRPGSTVKHTGGLLLIGLIALLALTGK